MAFLEMHVDGVMREKLSLNFVTRNDHEFALLVKHQVEGLKDAYKIILRNCERYEFYVVHSSKGETKKEF